MCIITSHEKERPLNKDTNIADNGSMVRSIAVAFKLLDTMVRAGEPMRITEIARQLGEGKAKVHRHLSTLRALGVVEQEKTSEKYRLGWKLFQLGQAAFEEDFEAMESSEDTEIVLDLDDEDIINIDELEDDELDEDEEGEFEA